MKKSGTFISFAFFGFLAQAVFDIMTGSPVSFNHYLFTVLFFMGFRFLLDWKQWKNKIQHSFLRMFIGNTMNDALSFTMFGGLAIGFINKSIGFSDAFTYGVVTTAIIFIGFEKIRIFSNWLSLQLQDDVILEEEKSNLVL